MTLAARHLASISDEKLQELRDRVDLVAVVQRRVPLKKSGHDWKGLCPFHGEKTSSFYVVPDKKMFHCFGCGVSGDAIKFVMQMEGRSFRESVEQLANEAGVDLTPPDAEEARRSARRASLGEVNEKACTFYERILWEHPKGEIAREHLRQRGITEDTAKAWRLGYAPNLWDSLIKSHALKGVDPRLVEEAGLGVPRKKGEGLYDRFRGRLTIPDSAGASSRGRARRSTSIRRTPRSTRRATRCSRWIARARPFAAMEWRCSSKDTSTPSACTRRGY